MSTVGALGIVGIVLFVVGILASVALHEAGHLLAAKHAGMWVRRYFVGFGPTVWSIRRGDTEYGVKALPLGGFCDIAGMIPNDEIPERYADQAYVRRPVRGRLWAILGGPLANLVLGLLIIYLLAVFHGLPNRHSPVEATVAGTSCVASQSTDGTIQPCTGDGPAAAAGLREGDVLVAVGGNALPTSTANDPDAPGVAAAVEALRSAAGPVDVTVRRDGEELTVPVSGERVQRLVTADDGTAQLQEVSAIGVSLAPVATEPLSTYSAVSAVPGTLVFTAELGRDIGAALARLPSQIPGVVESIFGAERAQDSPMSVVGASRVGGELASHQAWPMFVLLLAQLNLFLFAFNLLPVLPLDGGHILMLVWEKIRNFFRRLASRPALGPVDYERLAPFTMVMWVVLMGLGLVFITADIVNPVVLFK